MTDLERYREALNVIAGQNPNEKWTERELHKQVSEIIRLARVTIYGSPKPPKAVKVSLDGLN